MCLYTSLALDSVLSALNFWIKHCRDLIPERFTHEFIMESARFVQSKLFYVQ